MLNKLCVKIFQVFVKNVGAQDSVELMPSITSMHVVSPIHSEPVMPGYRKSKFWFQNTTLSSFESFETIEIMIFVKPQLLFLQPTTLKAMTSIAVHPKTNLANSNMLEYLAN